MSTRWRWIHNTVDMTLQHLGANSISLFKKKKNVFPDACIHSFIRSWLATCLRRFPSVPWTIFTSGNNVKRLIFLVRQQNPYLVDKAQKVHWFIEWSGWRNDSRLDYIKKKKKNHDYKKNCNNKSKNNKLYIVGWTLSHYLSDRRHHCVSPHIEKGFIVGTPPSRQVTVITLRLPGRATARTDGRTDGQQFTDTIQEQQRWRRVAMATGHSVNFLSVSELCWNWAKLRKTCSSEIWLTQ